MGRMSRPRAPRALWRTLRDRPAWQQWTAVVTAAAVVGVAAGAVAATRGSPVRMREQRLTVWDGPRDDQRVSLDTTLFVPGSVDSRHPAPAVMVAHGFGGSKDSLRDDARDLAGRGYVVLTYSARGFGRSTGQIALDSPDYEVKDARRLVDWLAHRPEVRKDSREDPRVGVTGGSYGGALALMLAAYDRRVDAVVPLVTWNDLSHAFFPNSATAVGTVGTGSAPRVPSQVEAGGDGVFKKLWAANFFATGSRGVATPDTAGAGGARGGGAGVAAVPVPDACGRFAPEFCAAFQEAARTGRASAATEALLRRSSPAPVLDRVRAPTLLIQGETDSLFPLSEADANARGLAAAGTPVKMVWFGGGHDAGTALGETDRLRELTGTWFDHYLKGEGPAPKPTFEYSRISPPDTADTGAPRTRTFVADAYPGLSGGPVLPDRREVRLQGPPQTVLNPAGGSPAAVSGLPGLGAAGALVGGLGTDLPGQSAVFDSGRLDVAFDVVGSPSAVVRLSAVPRTVPPTVTGSPGGGSRPASAVLFAKLYDVDEQGRATLPQQLAAPLRVTVGGPDRPATVRIALPAVVHRFESGHRMRLVLATTDQAYATPLDPAAYQVSLAEETLAVPRIAGVRAESGGSPVPWLVAGALVVAVVTGAATVTARRGARRVSADIDTSLAGVPLVIEHLTKTYGRGDARVTAVAEVSLRVERGQVLGLLGPNGAGKTTTLRILMGLLHPTAGRVRVFGHTVLPGAPVLSRVGSFVEGPGLLPHLSGMDNLTLYWRATGRPVADAHLDEALRIAGLGAAVHRRVRTYSQGMRQRLALAQAMLGLPDLLVLDEPTNGLDPPQIREMREVLRDYAAAGRTVLVSSHLLAEVEQTCTHVVVMHRGRVVATGTVEEIVGDADTVRVGVDDPAVALRVVRGIDGVRAVQEADGGLLVTLGTARRPDIVSSLVGAGVGVEQLVPRRRLEDAFLTLVGEET